MAKKEVTVAADYGMGPYEYPRGWFMIAEAKELDAGPMAVSHFGKDFALYRGESGRIVLLDAYCKHMGTHLTASSSAHIVASDQQAHIEGDSIRCPYHAWRYNADGHVDDILYHDGPCPKSASITSYPVREVMGMVLMWHHPEGGDPEFEPPYVDWWDQDKVIKQDMDHLGEVPIHGIEINDNMADCWHLGPTHGSPCEYFENEMRDHLLVQRQGGYLAPYEAHLDSVTWYGAGPGILLSKQTFGGVTMFEIICSTPVENGTTKCWHGSICLSANVPATEEDLAVAKQLQDNVLGAFIADFDVWTNKKPATKIMRLKTDGPFHKVREFIGQFYMSAEDAKAVQASVNGIHGVRGFPQSTEERKTSGYEDNCFQTRGPQ